jgi:hypothetical protein
MRRILGFALVLSVSGVAGAPDAALAASLRGSPAAMAQQNQVAKEHGLAFYRTADEIRAAVARGELVELPGNANYAVADFVTFPFLQPEVKVFIERLSAQYREACGQKLVVTSAVRPSSGQPSNAHQLSVHPAGMAVDLRVSDRAECRSWLEETLLGLERQGVLNGIREFHPPHYHVAVFPEQYMAYVRERDAVDAAVAAAAAAERVEAATEVQLPEVATGFVPENRAGAEPAPSREPRTDLAAGLVALMVLPFGIGVLLRGRRGRR